jgi:hypothetical protein
MQFPGASAAALFHRLMLLRSQIVATHDLFVPAITSAKPVRLIFGVREPDHNVAPETLSCEIGQWVRHGYAGL